LAGPILERHRLEFQFLRPVRVDILLVSVLG
jgi:hypothetical protein